MKRTVVFSKLKDKQAANLVGGYRHDPVNGIIPDPDPKAEPRIYGLTYGDDDIVSTVDDMFAYDQALRSGKLLKLETLEGVLIPPTLTDGSVSGYALGFGISAKDGLRYISHGGSTSGFWAFCKFSRPENDSTVILFTNVTSQRRAFSAIYEAINKIMLDQPFAAEPFPHNKQEKQRAPEIL